MPDINLLLMKLSLLRGIWHLCPISLYIHEYVWGVCVCVYMCMCTHICVWLGVSVCLCRLRSMGSFFLSCYSHSIFYWYRCVCVRARVCVCVCVYRCRCVCVYTGTFAQVCTWLWRPKIDVGNSISPTLLPYSSEAGSLNQMQYSATLQ